MDVKMECIYEGGGECWFSEPGCKVPYFSIPMNQVTAKPGDIISFTFNMEFPSINKEIPTTIPFLFF